MWEYISLPEKFLLYNCGGITADNKNWSVLNAINLQQIHLIFILTRFFMNHNKNIINDYKMQDTFFESSKPLMLIHADLTSIDPSGAKFSDIAMKYIFMHHTVFKNVVCKISTIRSRPQRVNTTRYTNISLILIIEFGRTVSILCLEFVIIFVCGWYQTIWSQPDSTLAASPLYMMYIWHHVTDEYTLWPEQNGHNILQCISVNENHCVLM